MSFVIQALSAADLPLAVELWQDTEGVGLHDSENLAQLTMFLDRNPGLSCAAFSKAALVGAVLVGHDGRRGFLYHLAVQPSERGRGIGNALVSAALARLRDIGILKCHVMVFRNNPSGQGFWRKQGWRLRDDLDVLSLDLVVGTPPPR